MTERVLAEYLRLSVEDGDVADDSGKAESDSIAHQREIISRYRREKNLYPQMQAMEIADDGYSGRNFERPGIKRLLSMVREGWVCCIIVKDDCVIIELNAESPIKCGFCAVSSIF